MIPIEEEPDHGNPDPEEIEFEDHNPDPMHRSTEIEKKKNEVSVSSRSPSNNNQVSPSNVVEPDRAERPSEEIPIPPDHRPSEPLQEPESP